MDYYFDEDFTNTSLSQGWEIWIDENGNTLIPVEGALHF